MSIIYTVLPCDNGDLPLVDRDEMDEDLSQYIDVLVPRGRRPQNRTASVRECKRPLAGNNTSNISGQNVTDDNTERTVAEGQSGCKNGLEGGIPEDVLEELLKDRDWMDSQNGTEAGGEGGVRQRRQAEGNGTDVEISSGASEDGGTVIEIGERDVENRTTTVKEVKSEEVGEISNVNNGGTEIEIEEKAVQNRTDSDAEVTSEEISGLSSVNNEGIGREIRDQDVENKTNTFKEVKSEERSEMSGVNNETEGELEVSNEILLNSNPATKKPSTSGQTTSEEMDQNYIQSKPEWLEGDPPDQRVNHTTENRRSGGIGLSLDYDDYSDSDEVLLSVCVLYIQY